MKQQITIDRPIVAVIQLATQPQGVIHQCILHPGKVKGGMLIRLGDFPGDEVTGWSYLANISIIQVLGLAVEEEIDGKKHWKCVVEEYAPIVSFPGGKNGEK